MLIRSASVLVAQLEVPLDAVAEALAIAHEAGAVTILNPAPAPAAPLPDSVLAHTDILVPNEAEFEAMTGAPHGSAEGLKRAEALSARLGTALVVTEGGKGVVIHERVRAARRIPAHKVEALDTVAAGDAFVGAMAVALAEGRDLFSAVEFANAAAAVSVTRRGAQPSLPARADILAMLAAPAGGSSQQRIPWSKMNGTNVHHGDTEAQRPTEKDNGDRDVKDEQDAG
jgi:ribokinase